MVQTLGWRTELAGGGAEAVECATRTAYAAILMDCQMPGMDGFEATARIRRHGGPSRATPIIALTASALPSDRERCLAAGMDDFLGKPITLAELAAVLGRWLRRPGPELAVLRAAPPGPRPAGDPSPTMVAYLRGLVEDSSPRIVREVIGTFLQTTPPRLRALRDAASRGDVVTVQRAAHSLKGSFGQIRHEASARLSARLEALCQDGRLEGAHEIVGALEEEYQLMRVALEAEMQRLGAA
jgi:CheY-like chemotaxis protein/HPt (histidine-containing phosphotransfer) domain-containing protein